MDPIIILQAGVASGTVLLFATLGEVFAVHPPDAHALIDQDAGRFALSH